MNNTRRKPKKQRSNKWVLFILLPLLVGGLYYLQITYFPGAPLPICPDCSYSSPLRPHLVKIAETWDFPPASIEALADELAMVETAVHSKGSASSFQAVDRDAECVTILVDKFDLRVYDYVQTVIAGLAGFGREEACPQLEALATFAVRVESLLSQTTKEAPRCKELLDWHMQQYSCSARQP